MPSYLGQYLVARALNPVLAASAFHLTFCVNSHAQMDDEDAFFIAVYCLDLSLWAQYCQPRHPYVRPVEYKASLFDLDC